MSQRGRAWHDVTPLDLLLAERLRRASLYEDDLARHEELRSRLRSAIEKRFCVTHSRRHAVRWLDVVAAARPTGVPRRLIRGLVEEMGGRHVRTHNRRLVRGMRPAEMDDVQAAAYARRLGHDPTDRSDRPSRLPLSRRGAA